MPPDEQRAMRHTIEQELDALDAQLAAGAGAP
jgi:hypothetical protein